MVSHAFRILLTHQTAFSRLSLSDRGLHPPLMDRRQHGAVDRAPGCTSAPSVPAQLGGAPVCAEHVPALYMVAPHAQHGACPLALCDGIGDEAPRPAVAHRVGVEDDLGAISEGPLVKRLAEGDGAGPASQSLSK